MKKLFPAIQKLGKSLMLPIAVLPVASGPGLPISKLT